MIALAITAVIVMLPLTMESLAAAPMVSMFSSTSVAASATLVIAMMSRSMLLVMLLIIVWMSIIVVHVIAIHGIKVWIMLAPDVVAAPIQMHHC